MCVYNNFQVTTQICVLDIRTLVRTQPPSTVIHHSGVVLSHGTLSCLFGVRNR